MWCTGIQRGGHALTERSSQRRASRRVTVGEAAALLGISKEAVRMRIRRGTLRSEKTDEGSGARVYVWLDLAKPDLNVDQDAVHHADEGSGYRELIEQLRSEVEAWREEARRKDHIIAGLIERLPPQLEGSSEPRESPESAPVVSEGEERAKPQPTAGGPQEDAQRPWWRRMFGG
jgi:excisionase family DNA binding protein